MNEETGIFYDPPTNTLVHRESKFLSFTLHSVWLAPGLSFFFSEAAINSDFPKILYVYGDPIYRELDLNPAIARKVHEAIGKIYVKVKQSLMILQQENMRDSLRKVYNNCYLTTREGVNGFDSEITEQLENWKPFQNFDVNTFMKMVTTISDLMIVMIALRQADLGPTNRMGIIAYLLTLGPYERCPFQLLSLMNKHLIVTDVIGREFKGTDVILAVLKPNNYFPFITDQCYLTYQYVDGKADYSLNLLDLLRSDRDNFGILKTPITNAVVSCPGLCLRSSALLSEPSSVRNL